jgi:hypothetical protein
MCALSCPDSANELGNVKQLDDLGASFSEHAKRRDDRFVDQPNATFLERYIKGEQCIAFRRVERLAPPETIQDGFIVQAAKRFGAADCKAGIAEEHVAEHGGHRGNQPLVLSQNVDLVKGPNGFIPTLIWIERFDSGSFAFGKPLFSFWSVNPGQRVDHVEPRIEDRKVSFGVRSFAVAVGQGSRNEVKAASQGIERGSDPSVEREGQRSLLDSYNDIAVRLRVGLAADEVWVAPLPCDQFLLEQWDLGFGPFDRGFGG